MATIRQLIPPLLLLPAAIQALSLDCANIRDHGQHWNLEKLGGPKTVHHYVYEPDNHILVNTTFTLDICKPLPKEKDVKKKDDCPSGTRVCAKEYDYRDGEEGKGLLRRVFPVAGEFPLGDGSKLEPKVTRLKGSTGNTDPKKEGLLIELNGGKKGKKDQRAVIEFLCDRDVNGNEGFKNQEIVVESSRYDTMKKKGDDDDEDDTEPNLPDLDKGKSLQFINYEEDETPNNLLLQWRTKFACEGNSSSGGGGGGSEGWGFFTWFIIILFLLAASYIIFGSWLNYNRYGARGWDLIPHGDTIRDIPYIVKDLGSNVADRLKGSDSRGGYSAV